MPSYRKTAIDQLLNLLTVEPFGTHKMGPGLNSTIIIFQTPYINHACSNTNYYITVDMSIIPHVCGSRDCLNFVSSLIAKTLVYLLSKYGLNSRNRVWQECVECDP